ncbi:hypothetical protein V8F20_012152 [Naviculisporaceae sp. PSN 640]
MKCSRGRKKKDKWSYALAGRELYTLTHFTDLIHPNRHAKGLLYKTKNQPPNMVRIQLLFLSSVALFALIASALPTAHRQSAAWDWDWTHQILTKDVLEAVRNLFNPKPTHDEVVGRGRFRPDWTTYGRPTTVMGNKNLIGDSKADKFMSPGAGQGRLNYGYEYEQRTWCPQGYTEVHVEDTPRWPWRINW